MTANGAETDLSIETIRALNEKVADPSFFCGGGSAAAITGSSAAALTLLVIRLNAGRKKNLGRKAEIDRHIDAVESIQQRLYCAANVDVQVLDALLAEQRQLKDSVSRHAYGRALVAAARSPYDICKLGLNLLEVIEIQLPMASRFTVSDLGAAAALTLGAIQGAMLTTDVNIALLRDEPDVDQGDVDSIEQDAVTLVRTATAITNRILAHTADAIRHPATRRRP